MEFSYNHKHTPPAPVLAISLETAAGDSVGLSAIVDTGADATIIPVHFLQQIGAHRVFASRLRSQWGETRTVFLYLIDVQIGNITLPGIYVVGDDLGAEAIVGRDVLNRLRLLLDGPSTTTHIWG